MLSKFKILVKQFLVEYDNDVMYPKTTPETNEFEDKINQPRKHKKDTIIQKRQNTIDRYQQRLNSWLDIMAKTPNIDIIQVEHNRKIFQNKINNKINELNNIKQLPISDSLFN